MSSLTTLGDAMRERVRVRMAVLGYESMADVAAARPEQPIGFATLVRRLPRVSLRSVVLLAEALECSPGWLVDGDLARAIPHGEQPQVLEQEETT